MKLKKLKTLSIFIFTLSIVCIGVSGCSGLQKATDAQAFCIDNSCTTVSELQTGIKQLEKMQDYINSQGQSQVEFNSTYLISYAIYAQGYKTVLENLKVPVPSNKAVAKTLDSQWKQVGLKIENWNSVALNLGKGIEYNQALKKHSKLSDKKLQSAIEKAIDGLNITINSRYGKFDKESKSILTKQYSWIVKQDLSQQKSGQ